MSISQIKEDIAKGNELCKRSELKLAKDVFEKALSQAEALRYIGGVFCCKRRIADILYMNNNSIEAAHMYKSAIDDLNINEIKEETILQTVASLINKLLSIALLEGSGIDKEELEKMKMVLDGLSNQMIKERKDEEVPSICAADEDYDKLVQNNEKSTKSYELFFNHCKRNALRLVLKCIHSGMDVNYMNPQTKYTALHIASWRGNKEVVCALLRHGADSSIQNGEGEDCLACATVAKQEEIVEILIRARKEGIGFLGPCRECEKHKHK